MASVGSAVQQFVPGPGVLVVGRDCAWNDRVGLNELLATGKSVFMPNTGKAFQAAGPIYGFAPNCTLSGPTGSPVLTNYIAGQVQNFPPTLPMINAQFNGGPALLLASAKNFGTLQAGTYVPLSGVMDSTAGTRYGIRTFNGTQRISFYSDGFQLGGSGGKTDYFAGAAYTVALAMYGCSASGAVANGLLVGNMQICGAHTNNNSASTKGPWNLSVMNLGTQTSPNYAFQLYYFCQTGGAQYLRWAYPTTATGVIRLYIMFDHNRTQWGSNVVVYMDTGSGPVQPTYILNTGGVAGSTIYNKYIFFRQFNVGWYTASYNTSSGSNNSTLNLPGAPANQAFNTDDFVLCGLHVESGLTYKDNGSGTLVTQAGAAITDSYAFYSTRSATSGLLPLTSNGSTLPNEIPTAFQGGGGYAFLFNYWSAGSGSQTGSVNVKNLSVVNAYNSSDYGDALAIAQILGCYLENLSLYGSVCAIRGWTNGSNNYYMRANTLQLSGDVCACAFNSDFVFKEVQCTANRVHFYFGGSGVKFVDLRIPGASNPNLTNLVCMDIVDGINNSSSLMIDGFDNDNEGFAVPSDCLFRANNCSWVNLKNIQGAPDYPGPAVPINVPMLALGKLLQASGDGAAPGTALVEATLGGVPERFSSLVRVEDPQWIVDIRNPTKTTGVHGVFHDVSSGCSGTVTQSDLGPLPFRTGAGYAGMHLIKWRPLAGQYAEWRCVGTGVYGSATLPTWLGSYPNVAAGSNQCAAYAMSCIGVNDGQSYSSFLQDTLVNSIIQFLFQATAWTPTATTAMALTSNVLSRGSSQAYIEVSSPEIQQINVTNNAGISGGTYTLTFNGQTTAAIATNTSSVASALEALSNIGAGNIKSANWNNGGISTSQTCTIQFGGTMANSSQPLITLNGAGLTGSGFSFSTTQTETGGGYNRVPVTFSAAANGQSSNSGAITFPTSTGSWNLNYPIVSWNLATTTSPGTGSPMFFGLFTTPTTVNASGIAGPTWNAGAFIVQHQATNLGGFTNYAADQILNAILSGTTFVAPTTWYVGLSSTPINAAGAGLTEPSGGGYARVSIANSSSAWLLNQWFQYNYPALSFWAGTVANAAAITFPTPTAAWSSGVSLPYWFLADAATGGNIWATGTIPVAPVVSGSTSSPPSFAPGSFVVQLI